MDYEFEQDVGSRSGAQGEGPPGPGINLMEGLTKIFSLGMSEIFDLSPDRPPHPASASIHGAAPGTAGVALRTAQRPSSPTTVRSRPGSALGGSGPGSGAHAPGSAPHGRKTRSRTSHARGTPDGDWGWGDENKVDVTKASCSPNSKAAVPGAQQGHRPRSMRRDLAWDGGEPAGSGILVGGVLQAVRDPAPEVHSSTFPLAPAAPAAVTAEVSSAKRQAPGSAKAIDRDTSGGAADQMDAEQLPLGSAQARAVNAATAGGQRPAGLTRSSSLRLLSGGGGEGKGLFDVLVTGVSSISQKATDLLNTLDHNFEQMFNPDGELMAGNPAAPAPPTSTTAPASGVVPSAAADSQHQASGNGSSTSAGTAAAAAAAAAQAEGATAAAKLGGDKASSAHQAASAADAGAGAAAVVAPGAVAKGTGNTGAESPAPGSGVSGRKGKLVVSVASQQRRSTTDCVTSSDGGHTLSPVGSLTQSHSGGGACLSPNSSKVIRIGVSPSKQGNTSPARVTAVGGAGSAAKAMQAGTTTAATAGHSSAAGAQGEGSILSMMLDTVNMEVKNDPHGSAPATTGNTARGAITADSKAVQHDVAQQEESAAVQQLVAELEAARQKCEELTLENIKLRASGLLDPALSDSVRATMEALVADKAALLEANQRLSRENAALQQLLGYTREHALVLCPDGPSQPYPGVSFRRPYPPASATPAPAEAAHTGPATAAEGVDGCADATGNAPAVGGACEAAAGVLQTPRGSPAVQGGASPGVPASCSGCSSPAVFTYQDASPGQYSRHYHSSRCPRSHFPAAQPSHFSEQQQEPAGLLEAAGLGVLCGTCREALLRRYGLQEAFESSTSAVQEEGADDHADCMGSDQEKEEEQGVLSSPRCPHASSVRRSQDSSVGWGSHADGDDHAACVTPSDHSAHASCDGLTEQDAELSAPPAGTDAGGEMCEKEEWEDSGRVTPFEDEEAELLEEGREALEDQGSGATAAAQGQGNHNGTTNEWIVLTRSPGKKVSAAGAGVPSAANGAAAVTAAIPIPGKKQHQQGDTSSRQRAASLGGVSNTSAHSSRLMMLSRGGSASAAPAARPSRSASNHTAVSAALHRGARSAGGYGGPSGKGLHGGAVARAGSGASSSGGGWCPLSLDEEVELVESWYSRALAEAAPLFAPPPADLISPTASGDASHTLSHTAEDQPHTSGSEGSCASSGAAGAGAVGQEAEVLTQVAGKPQQQQQQEEGVENEWEEARADAVLSADLSEPPSLSTSMHSSSTVQPEAQLDPTAHQAAESISEAGAQQGAQEVQAATVGVVAEAGQQEEASAAAAPAAAADSKPASSKKGGKGKAGPVSGNASSSSNAGKRGKGKGSAKAVAGAAPKEQEEVAGVMVAPGSPPDVVQRPTDLSRAKAC